MQIESSPLITIIVPVYNRAKIVTRTINSVIKQTYKNIELIVVNDGSTDNLMEELNIYNDFNIQVYSFLHNKGVSAARNHGLLNSNGDAILFLDSDDEIYPNYIYHMSKELFERNNDIVICRAEYDNNVILPKISQLDKFFSANSKIDFLLKGNIFPLSCILFSNNIKENIYFDTKMKSYEDFDFLLHVVKKFNHMSFLDEVLVKINDSQNSVNKNISAVLDALLIIKNKFANELSLNRVTDFYFKKNMISICRNKISMFKKFILTLDLLTHKEFLNYTHNFLLNFIRGKK